MNEFTLKKYKFGNYLGIVGDSGHSVLCEMRNRIDVDEDMPRLLGSCGLGKGDLCIDVGAFLGDTAVPMLERGCKVIAFEPFLDAYTALLYNTRKYPGEIIAYNAPAGNGEWVKYVYECPGPNFGMRRVVPCSSGESGAVQSIKLDTLASPMIQENMVRLMKIDCEGSEIPVLEGARELIKDCRPFLYIEHYVDGLTQRGYTEKDLTDCIRSLGYEMEMWGSPPRWDWFCWPSERARPVTPAPR